MSVDTNKVYSPIFGTNFADILSGTHRSEVFSGRRGNDTILAQSGSDLVYGGGGDDLLFGNYGNDILYGGGGPTYANLNDFTIAETTSARVVFIDEGAGYRNALGMYQIAGDGSITDTQILFPNSSKAGSGGSLIPGESAVSVDLEAGDRVGFFVLSNAYGKGAENQALLEDTAGQFELRNLDNVAGNILSDTELRLVHIDTNTGEETLVKTQYGYDIFHSATDAATDHTPNPDNYPHVVGKLNTVTGEVMLGFEDLKYGGDNDYDDVVFRLEIGTVNAEALVPEKAPPQPSSEDDVIYGGSGDDEAYGMAGNDIVSGGNGADMLWGNSGSDILFGDAGADVLRGGQGDDILFGGDGADMLWGNSGADFLYGDAGADVLRGGQGDDFMSGGSGADMLWGNSGADILYGDTGADELRGGTGDDVIHDGSGYDTVRGGSGDDLFIAGSGYDEYIGGSGFDTIDLSNASRYVNVNLHKHVINGMGHDSVWGVEAAIGTGFNDIFKGDKRDNEFFGGDGDDWFRGLAGEDIYTGGDGADIFFWRAKDLVSSDGTLIGLDQILDFGDGDVLDLSELLGEPDESDLSSSLTASESDTGTTLSANLGGNAGMTQVVTLTGVFDASLDSMVDTGAIIV